MSRESDEQSALSRRVREVRVRCFGEDGIEALANRLGIPARTWLNYESGVIMPATMLLRFLRVTGASPESLLDIGEGRDLLGDVRGPWFDEWTPGRN